MELENCCVKCGKNLTKINTSDINIDKNCYYNNKLESKSDNYIKNDAQSSDITLSLSGDINNTHLFKSVGNTYGDTKIARSKNIIIGNVTYITGPVYITQISNNINQRNVQNQLFLNDLGSSAVNIISRNNWMAQPCKQSSYLPEIPQYVIIAHTATEDAYIKSENALLVKLIQTFHMESRKWDDIAYNFLIGCDGNIFEGRGWNIQGAHTYGYNRKSICIAFIGCFMDHLPTLCALNAAKNLICEGVRLNFLPENYILVGHCQCSPIESPGAQLFNEIKKWPNWKNSDFLEF